MASTSCTASPRGVPGGVVAATCDGEFGAADPSPRSPLGGEGVPPRATASAGGTAGTAGEL